MNTEVMTKAVEAMVEKAAKSEKADDALKFSQAACNTANAMCSLKEAAVDPVGKGDVASN